MSAGWWPIDMRPPRDGTPVDLWVVHSNAAGRRWTDCAWVEGAWRSPDGRVEELTPTADGYVARATHWRSIPSGPRTAT